MKKKIALIAVFVLLTAAIMALGVSAANVWDGTAATGFASGSGTEADPYVIMTAEQLKYFADQVNGGNTFEGKFIKLGADIVLNDTTNWESWDTTAPKNTWTAIGDYYKYFSGTFDGDGHTVSGIYVYTKTDYQGLFGCAKNATIKNLGTEKSYIKGGNRVGGVVGFNYYSTVSNCYNTGTVSGRNYSVGGVVGNNYHGTVSDCYNTGAVSGTHYVGGVVGYNYNYGTVSNCYNTGTVSGNGNSVGGVVGESSERSTVSSCYNTGTVSGSGNRVGGVVGRNSNSTVSNCYYLAGCATDGNGTVQYGTGNATKGETTADISGQTTGLTDAQMKQKASFAGFDFDTVWTIGAVAGYDYPTLQWQKDMGTTDPDEPDTPASVWDGTAATGFASGSGTEADPYVIMTAEQLKYFANQVNGGNTFEGKFIKLGADIVLNDTTNWESWDKTAPKNTWTAIGNDYYYIYFSGTFDGDGHTVSGIYVYTETNYQGLFGYVQNAAIKNLGTEKSYIKGRYDVGGVVGYNGYDGTVSNCYNTGTVSGNNYAGGVVGYNYGTVSNCYNTGTVSGSWNYVGGVAGYNDHGKVSNCYNAGTVSGYYDVGGVAGYNYYGTVSNCYNTGAVSGNKYVGGVVGYNYAYAKNSPATVSNCYNTGTVNGDHGVGGVVGYTWSGTVSNCYNTGTVSGNNNCVGGVAGYNYSYGTVSNCYNTGTVSGYSSVGGVAGYNNSGTVSNCYYLAGCATDGNETVQYGIGNETKGRTTADVSGKTAGLTDAQMKQKASFAGFDFDTVWTIGVVEGYDYPTLQWQKDMGTTDPDDPDDPDEPDTPASVWDGTAATGFASGSGTEADPYIILTAEQLKYFANQVNGGNTFEGKFIKLGADIVLNDTTNWESWDTTAPKNTWTAIGNSSKYFSGTFDGDGHTVSGIYVYTETDYQGLFGYALNAAIRNLGVEKSYIKGGYSVGGVVGWNGNGTVSDCYNTGTVSGNGNSVGGVAGLNDDGTVSNCYNTGTVSGTEDVGGVVGYNYGTVSDCYNTGAVSGKIHVGGVVCWNWYGTVSNCYNTGTVNGTGGVGGVVGWNCYSTVSNCYNTGTVSGTDDVGGVVGYNYAKDSTATVSNCYNTGTVSGNGNSVGGVVGSNNDYVNKIINCYNTGAVSGNNYVGGVVGYNYYNTVSNCYNTGTVSGNGNSVGGVVGHNYGTVSNCYNTGTVSGNNYVGGVVGRNNGGTASNCYYLAGCATDGNGTVQYGIGNETKGKTTADVSGKTTGLTDAQMKQKASFAGFDFDTVWTIGDIEGYDYPTLKWQKIEEPDEPEETTSVTTETTETIGSTETTKSDGGCGSAIGAGTGIIGAVLMMTGAVLVKKKEE